jgi:hypothetical protein
MSQSLLSRRALVARAALAACMALGVPALAGAQQPTAPTVQAPAAAPPPGQPGVIVVGYFKCSLATQEQFAQARRASWTPVMDQAVREGRLLGYGELAHAWGDEWNYVHYFTARDEAAFHAAWRHVIAEVMRRDPQFLATAGRHCTEHKDNIYSVTHVSPPAAAPPTRRP